MAGNHFNSDEADFAPAAPKSQTSNALNSNAAHTLGVLADPSQLTGPVDITGQDLTVLLKQLRDMLVIRFAEEKIAEQVVAKKIVCPCHLAIGQEAVAVGVATHLRQTDRGFGTHRSHSHFLACGGDPFELFAEVLGRAPGCSKGMGGSMHLYAEKNGFKGSVPIVAGTVSLGVGAALAAKMDGAIETKTNIGAPSKGYDVGISYFGDGAVEEGTVHESMNMASYFKLPMLFVCENNLFSSHLHINLRQPADATARFAQAHQMNVEVVDGNDVVAVSKAAERLLNAARNGEAAGYLEGVTYRWRGHVGPSEDLDVGLKRVDDLKAWKQRDPVRRLYESLRTAGAISEDGFLLMQKEIRSEMDDAWDRAERSPWPETKQLLDVVYAGPDYKQTPAPANGDVLAGTVMKAGKHGF